MAANDLTTLADVKAWLGRTDANSDSLLASLITRASRQIYSYLQRPSILPHAVTEARNGRGGQRLLLEEWPVLSVSSVAIGGIAVPEASAQSPGWILESWNGIPPGRAQTLSLRGYAFGSALPAAGNAADVVVSYQAGYQVTNEAQTVSAAAAVAASPYGNWASDEGVSYANGAALLKVASAPAVGQYAPGPFPGVYIFNSGDNGASIAITYGYVPSDLADACIELVSERYRYSQRIGEKSHSLGGNETVAFDNTRLTPLIMSLLQPYRKVPPL